MVLQNGNSLLSGAESRVTLRGDEKCSPLPDYQDPRALANDFSQFFAHKMETIQERMDVICDNEEDEGS